MYVTPAGGPDILGCHLPKRRTISEQEVTTGDDIIFNSFSFLPADPTSNSFPWCSVEQGINLVWPYDISIHVISRLLL